MCISQQSFFSIELFFFLFIFFFFFFCLAGPLTFLEKILSAVLYFYKLRFFFFSLFVPLFSVFWFPVVLSCFLLLVKLLSFYSYLGFCFFFFFPFFTFVTLLVYFLPFQDAFENTASRRSLPHLITKPRWRFRANYDDTRSNKERKEPARSSCLNRITLACFNVTRARDVAFLRS